jgi:hypothetical protein
MEPQDLQLKPTVGLVSGLTIQFAEGHWREEIGEGVALSEAAFNLVEPHLRVACPEWTAAHRHGVLQLSTFAKASLVSLLRAAADHPSKGSPQENDLLCQLAEWLEARSDRMPISILGI